MSAAPPAWTPPPPAPPLRPDEERTWAILVHVLPLLGPGFVVPLVVWLVFRGRGAFLEHHAKESLNFQITALLALVAAAVLTVVTFGVATPLLLGVLVAWVVLCIVAAVAANRWEWYRYPATLRLVT
ncbi:DUF4870 domain-containing protein [Cellulomonas sp. Sa3CUA2]|uniref:DUF4870 domain-containing protein n=1 Tax=Cellulomonas avistercoris TaxID=2762242 RepID=A0ABR8QCH0_9CELL|nr:DUF4870 domain-containing protein [Cellulomonas avistercoris]MBD7918133.1 DUF4870 domain-containing protein [Cellulomonas avistercoris]